MPIPISICVKHWRETQAGPCAPLFAFINRERLEPTLTVSVSLSLAAGLNLFPTPPSPQGSNRRPGPDPDRKAGVLVFKASAPPAATQPAPARIGARQAQPATRPPSSPTSRQTPPLRRYTIRLGAGEPYEHV